MDRMLVFIFIILLNSVLIYATQRMICPGKWVDGIDTFYDHYPGVDKFRQNYSSEESILQSACPTETFMHNCFYHGITDRANLLRKRKWVSSDTTCKDYSPPDFLLKLKDVNIFFLGDSLMQQVWSHLICTLYKTVHVDVAVDWTYRGEGTDETKRPIYADVCANKRAEHCTFGRTVARIPSLNANIYFDILATYRPNMLERMVREQDLKSTDIIITGFGAHYNPNQEKEFAIDTRQLVADALALRNAPQIYYLDAFPQHFTSSSQPAGYYHSREATHECVPVNETAIAEQDWRNNLAGEIIAKSGVIKRIHTAHALYSQYDAHVAGDSKLTYFDKADCTHFCAPSGLFRYVFTMMYNTVFIAT